MSREITIALHHYGDRAVGYQTWLRKRDATETLKALRVRGLNVNDCVRIHPARVSLAHLWVIARPWRDAELTLLMCGDGSWAAGRLWDDTGQGAPWQHMPEIGPVPAHVAHVTRTAHQANRREIYRTKSNGSAGRWAYTDDSFATCTCGWVSHAASREEARGSARWHRTEMERAASEQATRQQHARRERRAARRAAHTAS